MLNDAFPGVVHSGGKFCSTAEEQRIGLCRQTMKNTLQRSQIRISIQAGFTLLHFSTEIELCLRYQSEVLFPVSECLFPETHIILGCQTSYFDTLC